MESTVDGRRCTVRHHSKTLRFFSSGRAEEGIAQGANVRMANVVLEQEVLSDDEKDILLW